MANPLQQLAERRQSVWIDYLSRRFVRDGDLQGLVDQGVVGVTSNPTIFQGAIAEGHDYDDQLREVLRSETDPKEVFLQLAREDIRGACDILRPVWDEGSGRDGWVSLEVDPELAHDTQATQDEAKRLHAMIERPNLLVKIPATEAGLPAIEEAIASGVPVNVTLIFSLERHRRVAEAYIRGLRRLRDSGGDLSTVASVASFFVSRVDTEADKRLDELNRPDLKGKLAIANAKLAYQQAKEIFSGPEWYELAHAGATPQRCLWASTSTKNPDYRDVLYVEELIGPDTVDTMPRDTVDAFLDHGNVDDTLERDVDGARRLLDELRDAGIDYDDVVATLEREGVEKFAKSVVELKDGIAGKRDELLAGAADGRAEFRRELGQQLRVDSVRSSDAAGSGHPTSSMSAADLMAVLLDGHLRLDYDNPDDPHNDHLVFSKGHASPLYYSMLKAAGAITDEELLTFRRFGSRLEGHPTPRIPPTDVATGSLGQGLPIAVGIALAGRKLDRLPYRVWCLCGDSEMAEGSMWEAFEHAAFYGLDNLTAIIDVNRLGQTRETMVGWNLDVFKARAEAFGWKAIEIDGHDVEQIEAAYSEAESTTDRPTAILARTKKGKGVAAVEDQPGKHGKALDDTEGSIAELGGERDLTVEVAKPDTSGTPHTFDVPGGELPTWLLGEQVATRLAYGEALRALGSMRGDVVALDGEVSNSTHSELFAEAHPDRYFEMFIAEQQLVSATIGMQARGWTAFASSFAAFFTRAYDFLRMAAISRANLRISGSHAGVSIGEDGPSQMALEDLAAFRAIHSSTVLHPSDANQTAQLVAAMADTPGITFLRTLRGKTMVRTPVEEDVRIGGSHLLRQTDTDDLTIVAMGITVGEAEDAADALADEGIIARVIDCYSVKPIDAEALRTAARETSAIITVEDHWPEGGLGDAVLEALADAEDRPPVTKLAVREMPVSGSPAELMAAAKIDADAIAAAARELVGARAAA